MRTTSSREVNEGEEPAFECPPVSVPYVTAVVPFVA